MIELSLYREIILSVNFDSYYTLRFYVKFNDSILWLKLRSQQKNENERSTGTKLLTVLKKRAQVIVSAGKND